MEFVKAFTSKKKTKQPYIKDISKTRFRKKNKIQNVINVMERRKKGFFLLWTKLKINKNRFVYVDNSISVIVFLGKLEC